MKTETKHTPTPWMVGKNGGDIVYRRPNEPMNVGGFVVGETEQDLADAAFIVRAVNAHDDLLGTAIEMRNHLLEISGTNTMGPIWKRLAEAIAKAEGR